MAEYSSSYSGGYWEFRLLLTGGMLLPSSCMNFYGGFCGFRVKGVLEVPKLLVMIQVASQMTIARNDS